MNGLTTPAIAASLSTTLVGSVNLPTNSPWPAKVCVARTRTLRKAKSLVVLVWLDNTEWQNLALFSHS